MPVMPWQNVHEPNRIVDLQMQDVQDVLPEQDLKDFLLSDDQQASKERKVFSDARSQAGTNIAYCHCQKEPKQTFKIIATAVQYRTDARILCSAVCLGVLVSVTLMFCSVPGCASSAFGVHSYCRVEADLGSGGAVGGCAGPATGPHALSLKSRPLTAGPPVAALGPLSEAEGDWCPVKGRITGLKLVPYGLSRCAETGLLCADSRGGTPVGLKDVTSSRRLSC